MNLSYAQKTCLAMAAENDAVYRQHEPGSKQAYGFFKWATITSLLKKALIEETGYFQQYHLTFKGKKVVRKFRKDWSHDLGNSDNKPINRTGVDER